MTVDDLARLAALRDSGAISQQDFERAKQSILLRISSGPGRAAPSAFQQIAGTAAGAMAGVVAGNALSNLLAGGTEPSAASDPATLFEGHSEFVVSETWIDPETGQVFEDQTVYETDYAATESADGSVTWESETTMSEMGDPQMIGTVEGWPADAGAYDSGYEEDFGGFEV